jgi:RNA polymerase sigma-70 factor (ECF subfamily)
MQYRNVLETYAYGVTRDWALAQDVVQNAFITVMTKWQEYRHGTSLYAWVRAITRLKTMEGLRARRREVSTEDEKLECAAERALSRHLDEDAVQRHSALTNHLHECIRKVGDQPLKLLCGSYSDGKTSKELASLLSMKIEAVRKALYRSRQRLKECVETRVAGEASS